MTAFIYLSVFFYFNVRKLRGHREAYKDVCSVVVVLDLSSVLIRLYYFDQ